MKNGTSLCVLMLALSLTLAAASSGEARDRIINLYDAFGGGDTKAVQDFGFSAYIEYGDTKILFDAGTSADILRRNTKALGIDLASVDFAVASHSHADHISGFDYLLEVNPDVPIYFPDDFFGGAAPIQLGIAGAEPDVVNELPEEFRYFGGNVGVADIRPSGRFWKAKVEYTKETTRIADGITLVATRSPFLGNFMKYPDLASDSDKTESEARLIGLPELSLVLETDEGIVVIVGCSHSTVEAIVSESAKVTQKPVSLVMGGYHLLPYNREQLQDLAGRLKDDLGVARVAPSHCTGHLAFKVLMDAYGIDFIPAGLGAEIPF